MKLSTPIDLFLQLIKWPVGVAALLLLPGGVWATISMLPTIWRGVMSVWPFWIGLILYGLGWWHFFRKDGWGSFLSTFEHELTHAIFAWATLHWVTGLQATWRNGGEITYRGRGNWLITIAPYFFPTFTLIPFFLLATGQAQYHPWFTGLLGVTTSYHITSTSVELHWEQTDLHEVGFPFAFCLLPTLNLAVYALILSYVTGGLSLAEDWIVDSGWYGLHLYQSIWGWTLSFIQSI